jgi:hypothetical protein
MTRVEHTLLWNARDVGGNSVVGHTEKGRFIMALFRTLQRIAALVLVLSVVSALGTHAVLAETGTPPAPPPPLPPPPPPPPPVPPTVTKIDPANLPAAVVSAIQTAQPGAVITAACSVTKDTQTAYQVEAKVGELIYRFLVGSEGKIINSSLADGGQKPVPPESLPQAVVEAVNKAAPNTAIVNAMQSTNGTATVYLIRMQGPGGDFGFCVAADGTILKTSQRTREDIPVADLPAAVASAVAAAAPDATIIKAVKETEDTNVWYNVFAESPGAKYGFQIDASGKILRTFLDAKVNVSDLPQAVLDAVNAIAPGITIDCAQKTTHGDKTEYHVFGRDTASRYAFAVTADGKMIRYEIHTRIAVADLPADVLSAANTALSGGTITEAMKVSLTGKISYVVGATQDGKTTRVAISEEGEILGALHTAQVVPAADLPAAVVDALNKAYKDAVIDQVCKNSDGNRVVYVVDLVIGDKRVRVAVEEGGRIVRFGLINDPKPENERAFHPVSVNALPQAVTDAVNTAVPDGTIVNAFKTNSKKSKSGVLYRVESVSETKVHTLMVEDDGTILKQGERKLRIKKD